MFVIDREFANRGFYSIFFLGQLVVILKMPMVTMMIHGIMELSVEWLMKTAIISLVAEKSNAFSNVSKSIIENRLIFT